MPEVKVLRTGKIGKVVAIVPIDMIDDNDKRYQENMVEVAFAGQLWTECYWEVEVYGLRKSVS